MSQIKITFVSLIIFLSACTTTATKVVNVKMNDNILQNITSCHTIILLKQNKLYAEYLPIQETNRIFGMTGAALDAGKNYDRRIDVENYFLPIKQGMGNFAFDRNFVRKIDTELKKLKWLNNSDVKKVALLNKKRLNATILDVDTHDKSEIGSLYLRNKRKDVLLVIDPSYKIDASFTELVLDATVYLYAIKDSLRAYVKDNNLARKILYKNNIRYSYRLNGVSTKTQASIIWSDKNGPHFINDIVKNSISSVVKLIAYDLDLFSKGAVPNSNGKLWSADSLIFGKMIGNIIEENNIMITIRANNNILYSIVKTNNVEESRVEKHDSNKKPVVYIYRPSEIGSIYNTDIYLNGKKIGSTAVKSYLKVELKPGRHTIMIDNDAEQAITFTTQAGRKYYINEVTKIGLWPRPNTSPTLVSNVIGNAAVVELTINNSSD